MKISVLTPAARLTPELLYEVMCMALGAWSADLPREGPFQRGEFATIRDIRAWSYAELVLVYDWAMREHLAASNALGKRQRRAKPYLVTLLARPIRELPL